MSQFAALLGKLAPKLAWSYMESKKDKILSGLNKKMNLPLMDEQDELELLEGVWSLLEDAFEEAKK